MLDPQGAILVERGDALGSRHKLWAALVGSFLHEGRDGLLGRTIVPGGQWVS
jgi:hypothetical protein